MKNILFNVIILAGLGNAVSYSMESDIQDGVKYGVAREDKSELFPQYPDSEDEAEKIRLADFFDYVSGRLPRPMSVGSAAKESELCPQHSDSDDEADKRRLTDFFDYMKRGEFPRPISVGSAVKETISSCKELQLPNVVVRRGDNDEVIAYKKS